jgi:hypothetical protein
MSAAALLAVAAIASLPNESEIATYRGVTAVSVYADGYYQLAVARRGRLRRLAKVERSGTPFDADVGPDTRGRPVVVFSDHEGDPWIHRLRGGGPEPIRTVPPPAAEPSVWRGRIAWVRENEVLTRNRLLARTTPSQRVPGVPRTAEDDIEVEVHRRLIATLDYHGPPDPDAPLQYLRLYDLDDRRGRRVWVNGMGIGGQTLLGLSFAGPWLGFHRSCFGDPGGCSNGARRYHVTDRRYEWETGYRALAGFALLPGGGTLELDAGTDEVGDDPNEAPELRLELCGDRGDTCDLTRRRPPWRPVPREHIRR